MSSKAKLPYDIKKATGEVCMVIRFRSDCAEKIRVACCRQNRVIQGYNGRIMGMTDRIKVYEDDTSSWPPKKGMILIQFASETEAMLWIESDDKFKNSDFPNMDGMEIFMIPSKYLVAQDKDYLTISLEEMAYIKDSDRMQNDYVHPAAKCMDSFGVAHGSSFVIDARGVRGSFLKKNSMVVLNRFKSEDHFENFYYSKAFEEVKEKRKCLCSTNVVVFSLNPDLNTAYAAS